MSVNEQLCPPDDHNCSYKEVSREKTVELMRRADHIAALESRIAEEARVRGLLKDAVLRLRNMCGWDGAHADQIDLWWAEFGHPDDHSNAALDAADALDKERG